MQWAVLSGARELGVGQKKSAKMVGAKLDARAIVPRVSGDAARLTKFKFANCRAPAPLGKPNVTAQATNLVLAVAHAGSVCPVTPIVSLVGIAANNNGPATAACGVLGPTVPTKAFVRRGPNAPAVTADSKSVQTSVRGLHVPVRVNVPLVPSKPVVNADRGAVGTSVSGQRRVITVLEPAFKIAAIADGSSVVQAVTGAVVRGTIQRIAPVEPAAAAVNVACENKTRPAFSG
jgi:hypothetical protein